jgi:hypothetical protein
MPRFGQQATRAISGGDALGALDLLPAFMTRGAGKTDESGGGPDPGQTDDPAAFGGGGGPTRSTHDRPDAAGEAALGGTGSPDAGSLDHDIMAAPPPGPGIAESPGTAGPPAGGGTAATAASAAPAGTQADPEVAPGSERLPGLDPIYQAADWEWPPMNLGPGPWSGPSAFEPPDEPLGSEPDLPPGQSGAPDDGNEETGR